MPNLIIQNSLTKSYAQNHGHINRVVLIIQLHHFLKGTQLLEE